MEFCGASARRGRSARAPVVGYRTLWHCAQGQEIEGTHPMSEGQDLAAATGGRLFRKEALERLTPPEQLDQRISLSRPGMRLMVVSAGAIIAAALVWAVFGSVPERALGQGVLLSDREGNFSVSTVSPGLVLNV